MRYVRLANISQKSVFQVTPENAKTQSWVTKTVWQRIPGRRARNSETPKHSYGRRCFVVAGPSTITVHCPVDTSERSSSADWRTACVDD